MYNPPSGQEQAGWDRAPVQHTGYSGAPGMQQPGLQPIMGQSHAASASYAIPQPQPITYPPPPGYPGQVSNPGAPAAAPSSNYPGPGSASYQQDNVGVPNPAADGQDSSRGLGSFMMNQGHSMAHAGHNLHLMAHPMQAIQYHTTGKVKRKVHQAVGKVLNKVLP